ncbi:hypothetical protein P43SY_002887 [Pythium insidiosum]|uniref:Ubiquitinyl hydrolase 1 n=1 Tax=Pythium insidiosum TaxID=114742 RepID=A0AAD5Q5S4_PYTIN|nr:hypothetical protein P43SY_002887 [Pythium insidiosum]
MTLHQRTSAGVQPAQPPSGVEFETRGPVKRVKRSAWRRVLDVLPILEWLPKYNVSRDLKFDIAAGITVAMMLIPQEVSLAGIMHVRPENGLYTAATAPFIYALFGSSTVLSVASGSEVSLLVGSALGPIENEKERIATGVLIAFIIGVILLLVRFLQLSQIADFFSRPVMGGFISAGGFLIMLSQVSNWLSIKVEHATFPPQTVYKIFKGIKKTEKNSFLLGLFSIIFLITLKIIKRRYFPNPASMTLFNDEAPPKKEGTEEVLTPVHAANATTAPHRHGFSLTDQQYVRMAAAEREENPRELPTGKLKQKLYFLASIFCDLGPLMVCIAGGIVGYSLGPKKIKTTGHVPGGLPAPRAPWYGFDDGLIPEGEFGTILAKAATISVVVYLSSIAMSKRLAIQRGETIRAEQELLGLGVASVVCGCFRAMPPTGGMSRTAVNLQNARTQLASIITVAIIILSLYTLTDTLKYLPKTSLSAIIIVAGYSLVEFKEARWLYRVKRDEFYVWATSFVLTLLLGVMYGLAASIASSVVALMWKTKRAPVAVLGELDDGSFVDRQVHPEAHHLLDVIALRVDSSLYFANCERVANVVDVEITRLHALGLRVKGVVLDAANMNDMDATTIQVLSDLQEKLAFSHTAFALANAKPRVHSTLATTNLLKRILGQDPSISLEDANKKKQKAAQRRQKEATATATATAAAAVPEQPQPQPVEAQTTKPLDSSKQCAIVTRLMQQADGQGLQVGDKRFVLAAKWWERWQQYVGYDDSDDGSSPAVGSAPGKINNLPLLQLPADGKLDELMGAPLRPQLKEGYHYVLLPQEVWDALLCWYGGGPAVARFVVEVGDSSLGNAFKRVEVYPELAGHGDDGPTDTDDDDVAMEEPSPMNGAAKGLIRRVSSSSAPKMCSACRKTTGALKRCGSCQLVWYCGAGCQTAHWKFHKGVCRSALGTEEKENAIQDQFESERRGKTGLRNLGNTCFMNSALQCLSHVELLTRYFLSNQYLRDLNKDNPLGTGGNLAMEYDGLLKDVWFGSSSSIAPVGLKRAIGRFAPQFSGFQQHDSQELLAYLIDGLHEDLNRVKQKPYTEVKESDGQQDDAEVAQEAWKRHLLRNDSIFVDHVQGQFKSTVVCPICAKVSITFDPYNCIQLELPIQQNRRMEVIVVPLGKPMQRLWVEVPKKGSMLSLKRAASKLCGIPSNVLLAADIYQSMVYRIVGDSERLARLRDEDRIVMYEVDPAIASGDDQQQIYYGFLYHRIDMRLVGDPLLFTFRADTTCEEILQMWSKMMSTHIAPAKEASVPTSLSPALLSSSAFLSNRDGAFQRSEPVPASPSSRFLDYATLEPGDRVEELVYVSITWANALPSSPLASLLAVHRPDFEHIVDHESVKARDTDGQKNGDAITLYDCFQNFTKPETLDQANLWYCSRCKEHRQARKTMEIWKLPDVLIVSLKRFEYRNEILRDKLDVFVDFPLEGLDMSPFCLEQRHTGGASDRQQYDLFAVSNHYGGMGFGHYTAFARNWNDAGEKYPGWYSFDDSQVSPVMPGQVKSSAAYILFYKRRSVQTE